MRWEMHVARLEERRGVYRVLVGKYEGQRPVGRHRRRWQDNIKIDLQERELGWTCLIWIRIGMGIFARNSYISSYVLPQLKCLQSEELLLFADLPRFYLHM
jgi:hypothetical protein